MLTVIKNGTIVSSQGTYRADILIEGEKIKKIGNIEEPLTRNSDTTIIDAAGKYIFPGFIDAHTHFDLHVAGTVTCDDFYTGTKAAVSGGTTTIIDFATAYKGESLMEGLKNWQKKAAKGCSCDYSFHMSFSEWNPDRKRECEVMMNEGITTFKVYMTYADMLDDRSIYEILVRLKEIGGITGCHCENSGLIDSLRDEYASDERISKPSSHYKTRPAAAEAEAINRLLYLAYVAGADVIDVHLTCEEGLNEIRGARKRGQKVYAETCPQYLLLDSSRLDTEAFSGAEFVCAPPLRTKHDNEVLWKAIAGGEIQTVSTDHCSFTREQRLLGKDDFRKIPGGLNGVEYRGILMFSEGVKKGRISLEKMCEVCSENPAKLYGMYPRKGVIAECSDADIVIIDPNDEYTIRAADQLSAADYCNYEGLKVKGRIESVFLRGRKVAEKGRVTEENTGEFIKRGKYSL